MKPTFPSLSWILIPVAASAGFLASRHHHHHGIPVRAEATSSPAGTGSAGQTSTPVKSGLISTWTARLAKCVVGDLPTLCAEIQRLPDKDDSRRAMMLLYARWVELDARGGLAFFSAIGDKMLRTSCRIGLLTEWAVNDPLAAYAVISQQPEKEAEEDLQNVGHGLLLGDPDKFWIWFQNCRKPLPWSWGVDPAWHHLAMSHFEELSGIAAELLAESQAGAGKEPPKSKQKADLDGLHAVLAAVRAGKDPDKAVEWARQLPESIQNKALVAALEVLIQQSPEKITDYLPLLKERQTGGNSFIGSGAEGLLKNAVGEMLKKNTLGTLEWLKQNHDKLGNAAHEVCQQFGSGLAADMCAGKMTPEQAFAVVRAAKEGNGIIRAGVLPNMWKGLPPAQLASTAQWLTTIESKDAAKQALQGIFPEWIHQDRTAALAFAATLTDKELAGKMFENMAQNSSGSPFDTFAENLTHTLKTIPPEYRAEIASNQIRMQYQMALSHFSPPFDGPAFASVLEGLPPGPATDKAFTQIASAWGIREPEAALAWASRQSDANLRKTATGAAVEAWAKEDAWATSQWVDAQPPGETRDTAANHLARSLRKQEPDSAWTWAGSIGDPATRLEAQAVVLREWRNSSPQEAAAAVDGLADKLEPADHRKLVDALTPPSPAK